MKNKLLESFGKITQLMWQRGWNEANGGNITVRLKPEEILSFNSSLNKKQGTSSKKINLDFDASSLAGDYFLCKGTGKFFRSIQTAPEENTAIIRIDPDGKSYTQLWGQASPTSETPAHLLSHVVRKQLTEGQEHVIMHCHLTNMIALSFVLPPSDAAFSNKLWMTMPECAVLFPEGIGVVPYLSPGTVEIGEATAKKMQDYRIVLWAHHGTFVSHTDLENGFSLLEAVEKSAEIVGKILSMGGKLTPMSINEIRELESLFDIKLNTSLIEQA